MEDALGDRQKMYENAEAGRRLMPLLPVLARIDGKTFSTFTKNMKRPFDEMMSKAMQETTKWLVKETNARCGYTQSDEITLLFYSSTTKSQIYYDGRLLKMVGDLAASTSVFFNDYVRRHFPAEYASKFPRFDARVWSVPTQAEAVNCFVWREQDAYKNSISMAARCYYSHKALHKKNGNEMQEMLFQAGVNYNDYPDFFKRGSYFQRKTVMRKFDPAVDLDLPPKHAARQNPGLEYERSEIVRLDLPPLVKVVNRVDVIFNGADPVMASEAP